jgi:pimeloyl-ACP methyl ester carboxylesterase
MRGYVDTSAGQIHYRRSGDSGPDIVLLHCANFSSNLYERALPLLGARMRAWAFDAPGVGESDGRDGVQPSHTELAATLLEAMDGVGIERAVVGGLHTGGRLSLEMARQRGFDAFPAAVLSGMGPVTPEIMASLNAPHLRMEPDSAGSQWQQALDRYRLLFPSEDPTPTEEDGWLQHMYLYSSMARLMPRRVPWPGPSPEGYELLSVYKAFPNPVLLLNTPEDCFSKIDLDLAGWKPEARLRMIEGIGPHLMLRDAQTYVNEIFSFLTDVGVLH